MARGQQGVLPLAVLLWHEWLVVELNPLHLSRGIAPWKSCVSRVSRLSITQTSTSDRLSLQRARRDSMEGRAQQDLVEKRCSP